MSLCIFAGGKQGTNGTAGFRDNARPWLFLNAPGCTVNDDANGSARKSQREGANRDFVCTRLMRAISRIWDG